jgi:hypothetical protein
MRRISMLAMAAAFFLSGCENYVVSEKPWFTAEDAVGAQAFHPGWWIAASSDCRVDPNSPSTAWPDCANATLVPTDWTGVFWAIDGSEQILAKGDPMIAQYELLTSKDAAVPSQHGYLYFGFSAFKRDAEGRALVFRYWPALCGPPRSDRPAAARRPWRGLRLKREGGCVADDIRALRRAAERSRALATETPTVRWLRDWRPGDQSEADWLAAQGIRTH